MPLVSVIIPSYNHEKFIGHSIKSVLNQTFQNFEIIITDDGSTDNTVLEIKKFTDPRIKLFVFPQNKGAADAGTNCLAQATGKYIALINSDDMWVNDKLEKQLKVLEGNKNVSCVFTDVTFVDEAGNDIVEFTGFYQLGTFELPNRTQDQWLRYFYFFGNALCHPSMLIERSVLTTLHPYNNRFRQLTDYQLWIDLVKSHEIYILPERLVKFRLLANEQNASSASMANSVRSKGELYLLFKTFFKDVSPELFKKAFAAEIINKDFTTAEEFYCEKALLLMNKSSVHTPSSTLVGYEMLYEGFADPGISKTLTNEYGITTKLFQNYAAKIEYFTSIDPEDQTAIYFNRLPPLLPLENLKILYLFKYLLNRIVKRAYQLILQNLIKRP